MKPIHRLWSLLRQGLSPYQVLGLILATGLVFLVWRPYQPVAAVLVILAGFGLILPNPRTGLFLTLLACPLFLGEPQDPFIILLPGLAGSTIFSWLIHLIAARRKPNIPSGGWLLFLAGLFIFNPPINLKELISALDFLGWDQILFMLVEGRKFHDLYALRSIFLNLGGLLFLACCLDLLRTRDLKPLGLALTGLTCLLGLVSLALWWELLPRSGWYLGINLRGAADRHHQAVLATTSFNRQYFNELLIFVLPILGGAIIRARGWVRSLPILGGIISLWVFLLTGQRSPVACLIGMALATSGLELAIKGRSGLKTAGLSLMAAIIGLIAVIGLDLALGLDLVVNRFLGSGGDARVVGLGLRPQVWQLAWEVFTTHPISGLGAGTFRLMAQPFADLAGLEYSGTLRQIVGTAHNTYLHHLAEYGLVTFLAEMAFLALILKHGLAAFKNGLHRFEAGVLLVALTGLILFGLFQHILYVTGIALLGLAGLAGLIILNPPETGQPRRKFPPILGLGLVILVAGFKIAAIAQEPYRFKQKVAFSYTEWLPDESVAWWTIGTKARFGYHAAHRYLVFPVSLPHPIVRERPMKVTIWVDDRCRAETVLRDTDWVELKLDLRDDLRRRPIEINFETSYAFWPARFGATGDRRVLGVMVKDPYPADD